MATIINNPDQLRETLSRVVPLPRPDKVLMVEPAYYSVDYIINPHMTGNVGTVDKHKARWEWEVIRDKFRHLGFIINVLPGEPGLPDMVFSANQSLPIIGTDGRHHAIMSIMHSDQRKEEVPFIEQWYRQNGYIIHYPDVEKINNFEGMGDALWHFKKRLLWGGFGYRSSRDVYEYIAEKFDVPVVTLELVHPSFYHLDTCLCILNAETVLIYPPAFTKEGLELIYAGFKVVLEAPETEAEKLFACNASCPDSRNVLIQRGCKVVNKLLKKNGFAFHEVNTNEFLKSGGSVFCMKLMVW